MGLGPNLSILKNWKKLKPFFFIKLTGGIDDEECRFLLVVISNTRQHSRCTFLLLLVMVRFYTMMMTMVCPAGVSSENNTLPEQQRSPQLS